MVKFLINIGRCLFLSYLSLLNKIIFTLYDNFKKLYEKIHNNFFKIFSPKIDVFYVIGNHLDTLIKFNSSELSIKDFFTFFLFPFLTSFLLIFILNGRLNENSINSISISLSIFIPILFSFLIGIFNLNKDDVASNRHYEVLKQIKVNISFVILISLLILLIIWVKYLNIEIFTLNKGLFSFIVLSLLIILFLSFIMILKRLIFILDGKLELLKL